MTVETLQTPISHVAALDTSHAIPGEYHAASDFIVTAVNAAGRATFLRLGGDYDIQPSGPSYSGGVLTLRNGAYAGTTLHVRRATLAFQEFSPPINALGYERALDRVVMAVQDNADALTRTLRGPGHEGPIGLLPTRSDRAERALSFDASGDPVPAPYTDAQILELIGVIGNLLLAGSNVTLANSMALNLDNALILANDGTYPPGRVVRILGHVFPGDGGGFTGIVEPVNGPTNPKGGKLRILGTATTAMYGDDIQRWLDRAGDLAISQGGTDGGGQLAYRSDSRIRGVPGSPLRISDYTATGSFMTPRHPDDEVIPPVGNVIFDHVDIDGSGHPAPLQFTITGASGSTITLPPGSSAIEDAYTGRLVEFASGAAVGTRFHIIGYDAANCIATLRGTPKSGTGAGDIVFIGANTNAIAGVGTTDNIDVVGCTIENLPMDQQVPSAAGGKAVNFEQGVTASRISRVTARNCATAFFFSGKNEVFFDGALRRVATVSLRDSIAENVGSVVTIAHLDPNEGPQGDPDIVSVSVSGVQYHNAGFAPLRIKSNNSREKSGVINLMGAQNAHIENVAGYNDPGYPDVSPGWPTDFPSRSGFGMTGPIGAVIYGHGRNNVLRDITHTGDVDAVVHWGERVSALGDGAGGTNSQARYCFDNRIEDITLHGHCKHVIATAASPVLRPPVDEMSGTFQIAVRSCELILDPKLAFYKSLTIDVTELTTGKRVIGPPHRIISGGNSFATLRDGVTDYTDRTALEYWIDADTGDDDATGDIPIRALKTIEEAFMRAAGPGDLRIILRSNVGIYNGIETQRAVTIISSGDQYYLYGHGGRLRMSGPATLVMFDVRLRLTAAADTNGYSALFEPTVTAARPYVRMTSGTIEREDGPVQCAFSTATNDKDISLIFTAVTHGENMPGHYLRSALQGALVSNLPNTHSTLSSL